MRILLAHNFYQQTGGEDVVFNAEKALLQARGDTVIEYIRNNNEIHGTGKKIASAATALWSQETYLSLKDIICATQPDVAHFHNTFLLISPSAYFACQHAGVPVVQTLHNFRLICPGALLLRNGKICEDCLGSKFPWRGAWHACWRDSRSQSAVVVAMLGFHNTIGTWQGKVDRYIALNEFSRQRFIAGGLPAEKIVVKPNFIPMPVRNNQSKGSYALFVGRLSREKGLDILLEAWQTLPEIPLKIVGDGPLHKFAKAILDDRKASQIQITGNLASEAVFVAIQNAKFIVMPSRCYENFPMVILEAFSNGIPVIVPNAGSLASLVENGRTGLHFCIGDASDLAEKVSWAWEHPKEMERMGQAAFKECLEKYTPEKNYQLLMDIYQQAILASHKVGNEKF